VNSSRGVVRVRVAAAVVVGLTLALAGCTATSPPGVLAVTDPGDGRSAAIGGEGGNGGVKLRNFLVVSDGQGKAGTLVGAISNETTGPVQVTLTVVSTDQSGQQSPVGSTNVSLQPSEFVQFGGPTLAAGTAAASPSGTAGGNVPGATGRVLGYRIPAVPERSGEVIQLFARTAQGGATINMPILPPVGEYAQLAPAAGSSATSSPSPTSSPGESSSPSDDTSATESPSGTESPSS
jgi:hypothetical protein